MQHGSSIKWNMTPEMKNFVPHMNSAVQDIDYKIAQKRYKGKSLLI